MYGVRDNLHGAIMICIVMGLIDYNSNHFDYFQLLTTYFRLQEHLQGRVYS